MQLLVGNYEDPDLCLNTMICSIKHITKYANNGTSALNSFWLQLHFHSMGSTVSLNLVSKLSKLKVLENRNIKLYYIIKEKIKLKILYSLFN